MPYRVDEFIRSLSDRDCRIRTPIEEIRMMLDAPEGQEIEATKDSEDEVVEVKETVNLLGKDTERAQRSPSRHWFKSINLVFREFKIEPK